MSPFVKNQWPLAPQNQLSIKKEEESEIIFPHPDTTQKRFVWSLLLSGNIYMTAIDIIERTYEQIQDRKGLGIQSIKIEDLIPETKTQKQREEMRNTILKVIENMRASENVFDRYPDTDEETREVKINPLLVRKLKIAAYKQQLLQLIQWSHKYTHSDTRMLEIIRMWLSKLGCTHKYIDTLEEEAKSTVKI